jgi:hypothetical protein
MALTPFFISRAQFKIGLFFLKIPIFVFVFLEEGFKETRNIFSFLLGLNFEMFPKYEKPYIIVSYNPCNFCYIYM